MKSLLLSDIFVTNERKTLKQVKQEYSASPHPAGSARWGILAERQPRQTSSSVLDGPGCEDFSFGRKKQKKTRDREISGKIHQRRRVEETTVACRATRAFLLETR